MLWKGKFDFLNIEGFIDHQNTRDQGIKMMRGGRKKRKNEENEEGGNGRGEKRREELRGSKEKKKVIGERSQTSEPMS